MRSKLYQDVLEKATIVDEYAIYEKHLSNLIADNILVRLPDEVSAKLKNDILMESVSSKLLKKHGMSDLLCNLHLCDLISFDMILDEEKEVLSKRVLKGVVTSLDMVEKSETNWFADDDFFVKDIKETVITIVVENNI